MKKNVLILDDDKKQLAAVKALLKKNFDCEVFLASSVHEAENLLKLHDFNLFILDIVLPDGTGINFAQNIRRNPKYAVTWIVILSGHDSYAFEAIRQAHCYDYLIKPYSAADLLRTVRPLLKTGFLQSAEDNQYLRIEQRGLCYKINMNDILYIEVNNRTTDIHTAYQTYSVKNCPLSNIKSQLKGNLCQCHRSFIVNLAKMHAVVEDKRQTYLKLAGCAETIPVGVKYKSLFKEPAN